MANDVARVIYKAHLRPPTQRNAQSVLRPEHVFVCLHLGYVASAVGLFIMPTLQEGPSEYL